jgi:hypothetical protein
VETPSWAKPLQRLSDDDPDVKAFRLRDENTRGTDCYQKAYGNDGVKRSSDGRIIAKTTLREDADRPRPKRDDDRGYSPDGNLVSALRKRPRRSRASNRTARTTGPLLLRPRRLLRQPNSLSRSQIPLSNEH